jgi:hypothetical protein
MKRRLLLAVLLFSCSSEPMQFLDSGTGGTNPDGGSGGGGGDTTPPVFGSSLFFCVNA